MTSGVSSTSSGTTIGLEASILPKLNLADFQNAVPFLRELIVSNTLKEDLREVDLHIESIPPFFKPKTWRIESVGTERQFPISDLDLSLDGALLSRLNEAETATVQLKLCRRGDAATPIAHRDLNVELLPRNQWGGLVALPEMVAAFVQPNDPAVPRLQKQTSEVLRKHGKNAALNGYEGGAKRAWELVSGLWSTVTGIGLDYALPPAASNIRGRRFEA
ncbi:MAG: hypothetical protein U1F34_09665 [Gammaproteobacteria bacterium]